MTECEKTTMLLSAYYDGELSADERELVSAHLNTCESCAALLRLFENITDTLSDTEPPEELRERVMKSVLETAPAPSRAANTRLYVLRRAVPAAACLAIVLLALSLFKTLGGSKDQAENTTYMTGGNSPSASMQAAPEAAPRDTGAGDTYEYDGEMGSFSADFGVDGNGAATVEVRDTPEPDIFGAEESEGHTDTEASMEPSAPQGKEIPAETPPPQTPVPEVATAPQAAGGSSPTATDDSTTRAGDYSAYYAVIKVTGALPPTLSDNMGNYSVSIDISSREQSVIIPRDVADALIAEGYDHVMYNADAAEAVVVLADSGVAGP